MRKTSLTYLVQVLLIFCSCFLASSVHAQSSIKSDIVVSAINIYKETNLSRPSLIPQSSLFTGYDKPLESGQYWLKVNLNNSSPYSRKILLKLPSEILSIYSIQYLISGDTLKQKTGFYEDPDNKKYILAKQNLIEAEAISQSNSTIYIHLQIPEGKPLDVFPEIHEIDSFRNLANIYRNIALVFSSIFIILGLYNFILYFILKERGFFFYSLMVWGFALHAGLPMLYHFIKAPICGILSIIAASFIVFAGSHFSIHFLKASDDLRWNKLLRTLALISISMVALIIGKTLFSGYNTAFNSMASLASALLALILITFWIGAAISVWKLKDIRGKYFLLINIPIILGGLTFILVWLGMKYEVITRSPDISILVTLIFYIGAVIQLVAFSLVFGYHIRGLEYEKLEIQTQLNRELEDKVKERTNNLQDANEKIGEQKDSLKRLNDLKDKLFTIISHDLRSPLNSLKGMLGLFNTSKLPEADVKMYVTKINNVLSHTTTVLDNLLNWSKSQMSGIQVKKSWFFIDQLIEANLELTQPLIEDKKIQIHKELFPLKLYADENMINIVIRNLLSNAIKFTHLNGKIDLIMNEENLFIEVTIKDSGVGMSEKELAGLFQIRNHHSSVGTLNEKGTGLGLLLSQEFIKHNGGEIKVKSERNKGAEFIFSLPLQDQSQ